MLSAIISCYYAKKRKRRNRFLRPLQTKKQANVINVFLYLYFKSRKQTVLFWIPVSQYLILPSVILGVWAVCLAFVLPRHFSFTNTQNIELNRISLINRKVITEPSCELNNENKETAARERLRRPLTFNITLFAKQSCMIKTLLTFDIKDRFHILHI